MNWLHRMLWEARKDQLRRETRRFRRGNKYKPHQGEQECYRRCTQILDGKLKEENGLWTYETPSSTQS